MQNYGDMTIKELASRCETVDDVQKVIRDPFKDTLQVIFEAEMELHLGYAKPSAEGIHTGSSRNGYSKKTIKTKFGNTTLNIPRDRKGVFEPQIIKKHETGPKWLGSTNNRFVLQEVSTRDIEDHMQDIYFGSKWGDFA